MRTSVSPFKAQTVAVSASTTSANGTLAIQTDDVIVSNPSTSVAFVRFSSTAAPTAVTTDFPVVGGSQVRLTKGRSELYIGVILNTGTGTIYFSPVQSG